MNTFVQVLKRNELKAFQIRLISSSQYLRVLQSANSCVSLSVQKELSSHSRQRSSQQQQYHPFQPYREINCCINQGTFLRSYATLVGVIMRLLNR